MMEQYIECYVCGERYPLDEKHRWMHTVEHDDEVYDVCFGKCYVNLPLVSALPLYALSFRYEKGESE